MANNNIEQIKQHLFDLNNQIAEMEQKGKAAQTFFDELLSDKLIFRRVSGKVIGKNGEESFMGGLEKPSPFTSRQTEDVSVTLLDDDHALVTLIVVGNKKDGSVGWYRNVRLFVHAGDKWVMEFWYNYEISGRSVNEAA